MRYAFLLILPLLTSCLATSGDLREIATSLESLETGVGTVEEVKDTVSNVLGRVEDRGKAWFQTAEGLAGGGVLSVLTGIGTIIWRNRQRRQRGEPVTASDARADRSAKDEETAWEKVAKLEKELEERPAKAEMGLPGSPA